MGDYFKKTAFSFKYGYYAAEWLPKKLLFLSDMAIMQLSGYNYSQVLVSSQLGISLPGINTRTHPTLNDCQSRLRSA